MLIEFSFEGDLADEHALPAYLGTQSIEGLSRTLSLITHYAVTGTIRHRYPFSDDFRLDIIAFEPGSFRTKIRQTVNAGAMAGWLGTVGGGIALGVAGNFVYDLLKSTTTDIIGQPASAQTPALQNLQEARPGDLDALREAATPSTKKGHSVIANGAGQITIFGNGNTVTVLDQSSKHYLEEDNFDPLPEIKIVSVGMLNVNTRHGRVFDYELGRLVSINVDRICEQRTLPNLARSLGLYARDRNGSQLYIRYRVRRDRSGNPIRYYIEDAWFEGENPPR